MFIFIVVDDPYFADDIINKIYVVLRNDAVWLDIIFMNDIVFP